MVVINPPEWKLANRTSVQWNRHKESVKETILCTSDPNNKVKEIQEDSLHSIPSPSI